MITIETWNREFSNQSPAVPDQVNGPQMTSVDIQKFIEGIEKSSISNHVTKKYVATSGCYAGVTPSIMLPLTVTCCMSERSE